MDEFEEEDKEDREKKRKAEIERKKGSEKNLKNEAFYLAHKSFAYEYYISMKMLEVLIKKIIEIYLSCESFLNEKVNIDREILAGLLEAIMVDCQKGCEETFLIDEFGTVSFPLMKRKSFSEDQRKKYYQLVQKHAKDDSVE
jgi:hypothetical protein